MIHITHYHRRPTPGNFSMERLFAAIRSAMPEDIACTVAESRFLSRGLFRRLFNMVEGAFHQGDVNHITGDVHFLALLLNRRDTILTIHDCGRLDQLSGVRRLVYRWLWFDLPIRRATVITAISEASRQDILKRFACAGGKVRVIHDCLPGKIKPDPREFNHACPTVLQVGTRANKNLERVAAALKGIRCRLDIVGRLSDEQRRCLEDNGIDYTCAHDLPDEELLARYRTCDMLVFASTCEGFGLPIVEAQATGRPVVTSDLPPMPEVGGDAACYVDPYDIDSIRDGIRRVIDDQEYRDQLVAEGFRNVGRFTPEAVAGEYAKLYRELYERNGGAA
jgi:glycosyltransferase involved in cell wall biosynthesis